jgi:hypothetical protein
MIYFIKIEVSNQPPYRLLARSQFCSFSPLFTLFRAAYTPSFDLRAERRKTKKVKGGKKEKNSSHFKDHPPKMAWG